MTPLEYGNKLLEEVQEINFQQQVLGEDLEWIKKRLDEVHAKALTATSPEERAAVEKEMEMVRRKFKLNVEEQAKSRQKIADFNLKLEGFKGANGLTP